MNFRDRDMDIADVINHIRNREYMSGVDRDKARVRSTGEVFTPTELVLSYIDQCELQNPDAFTNSDENFCDNSCGDGQFLGEILIRKMERGLQFETALRSLHGVDFQESNIELCKQRLLCGREDLRHIVDKNLVCADSLKYHYRFDGTPPYSMTVDEYEAELERHRAEKHQMHKKVGGYRTEIKKLRARVKELEEQLTASDLKNAILQGNGLEIT